MKVANPTTLTTYKRLIAATKPYAWFFVIGLACTAAASGIDAGLTWLIKPIINNGLVERDQVFIKVLPLIIVGVFIVRGVAVFFSNYCIKIVGRSLVRDFRQRIFSHMLKLPASFYDSESSGKLLSRLIYNVEQVSEASTYALLIIVQESVLAIGLVVVMFTLSWKLTLFFMIIFPFMVWVVRMTSKRLHRLSHSVQQLVGEVSHIAEESIEGYRVIRTFGGEQYETNKFNNATEGNQKREMKIISTESLGTAGVQVLISFSIAAVLVVATLPFMHVSAGSFAALVAAMFTLLRPIRRINQVNNTIQKGVAGAQSIFELLDSEPEKDTGTRTLGRSQGAIEYRGVNFTYHSTGKTVLHDLNFRIEPGETVALVGRSGSGKSTLVSLLPRFYDIDEGSILIDNVDVREYRLADLRSQFALVSQQVTLFKDTVARNIAYGQLGNVSQDDLMRAAEAAHALEFIQELPQQMETMIGENGVLLSGGQRQRLAIARALLKNAPILILDEATSALDNESERHIQAALETLMRNRTTLVIAHRLSTIENADRIFVMDKGRIIESGSHQQLLNQNGHYAKLYEMQFTDATASHE